MFETKSTTAHATVQATSIFHPKRTVKIDEKLVSKYATDQKIETLIEELTAHDSPLIALGNFGPSAYVDTPFKLKNKVQGQDIYGWKPQAERKKYSEQKHTMILGAENSPERQVIYFTMSADRTEDSDTSVREHIPSFVDKKIYCMSYKTFHNYVGDVYLPQSAEKLPDEDKEYIEKLISISPLDSILDEGEGERNCKAIGQEIFDKFKSKPFGGSMAGRDAAVRICEAVKSAPDGRLRMQYIERAWDGIGDESWTWRS